MLDTTTKRRIDTARDILVGKVPDPKSQVEQITIALIYKFMDDMDLEAEELGGIRSFFTGEYEKYSWHKLFDSSLSGFEVLNLYGEALVKLSLNPSFPQLFRDIFKNAYLPYRDPETLKSFIKIINDFNYDHSEKLGDAFEYLLSVLGSQGDAGQFRTPRHIIDFMVELIDPKKTDTILDPACGTAGFLISSYKHIWKHNSSNYNPSEDKRAFEVEAAAIEELGAINGKHYNGDKLTPEERSRLTENISGYDISPDMVRLSLVNLYLHGFTEPHIYEYDTLTSQDRWNEYYDVIMANPPFMSPKGGIRPHKRFSMESSRSEVLFVDYIAEHLKPTGHAAVIVPEGIIFQGGNAYKQLRKMLVEENYLVGVISLPAGVFNPYSGVKTSILWIDKSLARKTDKILFVKIANDGFDLGAQRRPIKLNDLPEAYKTILLYRKCLEIGDGFHIPDDSNVIQIKREQIAAKGDYNLSGDRYKATSLKFNKDWPWVRLGEVCSFEYGKPLKEENRLPGEYPVYGSNGIVGYHNSYLVEEPFLVIGRKGSAGAVHYSDMKGYPIDTTFFIRLENEDRITLKFLFHCLQYIDLKSVNTQAGVPGLNRNDAYDLKIPLPPVTLQNEIVAEIESYKKIINGARQVVENYKPMIDVDPEWPVVELGEVCEITSSKRIFQEEYVNEGIPFYRTKEIVELNHGTPISLELFISRSRYNLIKEKFDVPTKGDILLSAVGTIGISWVVEDEREFYFKDGNLLWIKTIRDMLPNFLKIVLDHIFINELDSLTYGAAYKALTIIKLKGLKVPRPSLQIQQFIVDQIEEEQQLVASSKRLIELYEQKIKDRIAKVWGTQKDLY